MDSWIKYLILLVCGINLLYRGYVFLIFYQKDNARSISPKWTRVFKYTLGIFYTLIIAYLFIYILVTMPPGKPKWWVLSVGFAFVVLLHGYPFVREYRKKKPIMIS